MNTRKVFLFALWIVIGVGIAIMFLSQISCVYVPKDLEDSVHSLHKGNVIIGEDYLNLLLRFEAEEIRLPKLQILEKHLRLSKELDTWITGKGK